MSYSSGDDHQWDHDGDVDVGDDSVDEPMSPKTYGLMLEHYNALVQENQHLLQDETNYLTIKSDPIVIQDPCDDEEHENPVKFPYLKRGSGLTRFNMTADQLKKGPPDLYKKKEFKSFMKSGTKSSARPTLKPVVKPLKPAQIRDTMEVNLNAKSQPKQVPVPERKFATNAVKSFDDQVIPALRPHRIVPSDAFEVPIPKHLLIRRSYEPKSLDVPKTPMKELVLKPIDNSPCPPKSKEERENEIFAMMEQRVEESDFSPANSSVQKLLNSSVQSVTPTARRLSYVDQKEDERETRRELVVEAVKRKGLTDNVKELQCQRDGRIAQENEFPCFRNQKPEAVKRLSADLMQKPAHKPHTISEDDQPPRKSRFQIEEAMKRKGLTDNVKKHLAWNTTPRRRRPVCIVKKVKIKKPHKKEKLNLHELKDRLDELEKEKSKLQLENYKIKRIEKDYFDEKLKLDKQRREMENALAEERGKIAEERVKLLEDQKKLKREKSVFEKYCQETRNLPTREEREEIRNLKVELEQVRTQLKTKEARVGASQAQLRNRIVVLERENAELNAELEEAKKVTVKKVRFESEGRIKSKVIDAINKQLGSKVQEKTVRPVSARERVVVRPQPLRRSKSAADLKPAGVRVRARGSSSGATLDRSSAKPAVPPEPPSASGDEEDCEVIDLVGEELTHLKTSECDSGIDSRHSSSDLGSVRSGSQENSTSNHSAVLEIKKRIGNLLGKDPESASHCTFGAKDTRKSSDQEELPAPCREWLENRKKSQVSLSNERNSGNGQDYCRTKSGDDGKFVPCWDRSKGCQELDISNDCFSGKGKEARQESGRGRSNISSWTGSCGGVCGRHGLTVTRQGAAEPKVTNRDVVRTELADGDVMEEELLTGKKRLWCGACGACETTYRNRPGYRRISAPDGNIKEEHPDGVRECRYKTGETVRKYPNGDKLLLLPNGEREFTTRGYKKLENPDGVVKILYDDGRQETRYPGGRVRLKDNRGHLIMDTAAMHSAPALSNPYLASYAPLRTHPAYS